MKLFEFMSFNIDWFVSPPGILITVGIVLLLVALILLLTTKKSKVEEATVSSKEESALPVEPVSIQEPQMVETVIPMEPVPGTNTPSVSIYGGSDPSTDIFKSEPDEVKPVIYGGANPLENTAPIPKMDSNSIYNTPIEEVKTVEPVEISTVEPVQAAVIDNTTNTIPAGPSIMPNTQFPVEEPNRTSTSTEPEIEELDF